MPRDARVTINNHQSWTNKHESFVQPIELSYDVWNPPAPVTDGFSDLKLTVTKLQSLLSEAVRDGVHLRAYGGGWSLSKAAVTDGRLVNTKPLNWWFPLKSEYISAAYSGTPSDLVFAQCGITVEELNRHLAQRHYALKTSGASNGQTIVGAVSTGTHGSAIEVGSMQDYVVGIHLITSPIEHVWLERGSHRAVSDAFISKLRARLIRDDDLFAAALVSFGSFGLIHGFVLETEPLYLLEASRQRLPLDTRLRTAMDTLDFSILPLPYPNEKPFHFEIVINTHDMNNGAYYTAMYKRPYRQGYNPPVVPSGGLGPGDDLLALIGKIGDVSPGLVPHAVNLYIGGSYSLYANQFGTHGEIFGSNHVYGKATSTEIGVDGRDASRALDCLLRAHQADGPFAGVFAFRFVRQSSALLAFTKFPYTCTIELPGAFSEASNRFFRRVWNELEDANIPYTLHWGQENNFTPARVRKMYGSAIDKWKEARDTLLDAQMRAVFSSPFLQACGLSA